MSQVSYSKNSVLCGKNSVLGKIRESLLCVASRCIKITTKLILASVFGFKFCPTCKNRVKLVFIDRKLIKVSRKTI